MTCQKQLDSAITKLAAVLQERDNPQSLSVQQKIFAATSDIQEAFDTFKELDNSSHEAGLIFGGVVELLLNMYHQAPRELQNPQRVGIWFDQISKAKTRLQVLRTQVSANSKEEGPKTWRDQLSDAADKLFGLDPEESEAEKRRSEWVRDEIGKSRELGKVQLRLLKRNEFAGVVTLPVLMGRSFISDLAWAFLEKHYGFELDHIMYYPVIKNAKLVGIHQALIANPAGRQRLFGQTYDLLRKHSQRTGGDVIRLPKKLVPHGPIKNKGRHFYALLLPHQLVQGDKAREMYVSEWDFASHRVAECLAEDNTKDITVGDNPQQYLNEMFSLLEKE